MRILVVDDSALVRVRLVAMLREVPGAELSEAGDGGEALGMMGERLFDLVLLDVHLPDTSGIDVLPIIKARPSPPIVVMLTSHPTEHLRRLSLARGADLFLDKSLDFARVVDLVAARLGRGR